MLNVSPGSGLAFLSAPFVPFSLRELPAQILVSQADSVDFRAAFYAVYDLKILFLASVSLFEIGSALCGAAPDMNSLIVGRVLAGVGGSGVYIGYYAWCNSLIVPRSHHFSGSSTTSQSALRTKIEVATCRELVWSGALVLYSAQLLGVSSPPALQRGVGLSISTCVWFIHTGT